MTDQERFLVAYGRRGPEALRQAKQELYSVQNSRKALIGRLAGLRDPALIERKARDEQALRRRIAADPGRNAKYGSAWERISASLEVARQTARQMMFLEHRAAFDTNLFGIARTIVRLVEEDAKPNAERLREYGDAARASLEQRLYSPAPIYPEFEEAKLARSLTFWRSSMGDSDSEVARILAGRKPEEMATELVRGSHLADVTIRKKLVQGGRDAVTASADPMIRLARDVDSAARAIRKIVEDQVDGVQASQYALVAKALFEDQGTSVYPDATFTLRLAFGAIKGVSAEGERVPAYTTFAGAFSHASRAWQCRSVPASGELALGPNLRPARPRHSVELRVDGRHHWRQLGQPSDRPARRGHRVELRPQSLRTRSRLRLRRPARPKHRGRRARHH